MEQQLVQVNEPEKKNKLPLHNRPRVVLAADKMKKPVSHYHIKIKIFLRFINIIELLQEFNSAHPKKFIPVKLIHKMLNKRYKKEHGTVCLATAISSIRQLASIKWIDMKNEDGKFERQLGIGGPEIFIYQGAYNKKRNLLKTAPFMEPTLYARYNPRQAPPII